MSKNSIFDKKNDKKIASWLKCQKCLFLVKSVEKVEFCVDRERGFHPGIVGSRASGNLQLLRQDYITQVK